MPVFGCDALSIFGCDVYFGCDVLSFVIFAFIINFYCSLKRGCGREGRGRLCALKLQEGVGLVRGGWLCRFRGQIPGTKRRAKVKQPPEGRC